jgi:hypothetical protein
MTSVAASVVLAAALVIAAVAAFSAQPAIVQIWRPWQRGAPEDNETVSGCPNGVSGPLALDYTARFPAWDFRT